MYSTVLIIPADLRDEANAFGESLGYGPNNYTVPLQTDEEVTHYGLHAWMDEAFKEAVEAGNIENEDIKEALIYSFRTDYTSHFDEVCAEHGLSRE
jgi:hypothetical protein